MFLLWPGASVFTVHGGRGGEPRPGLPYRIRRVVPAGSTSGVVHQVDGGDPLGPSPAPDSPARPLDLCFDEHCFP